MYMYVVNLFHCTHLTVDSTFLKKFLDLLPVHVMRVVIRVIDSNSIA